MARPINLAEYAELATQSLSPMALDYYRSGSWDEITLRENRTAFEALKLRPRMLMDVSQRDLSTTLLDKRYDLPILVAPMAFQCLAHPEGEIATAQAAMQMGATMVLSTMATQSLEAVATTQAEPNSPGSSPAQVPSQLPLKSPPKWFQLYVHRDRGLTQALVERAEAAGYEALCLTVDAPVLGKRERDHRNQFVLPSGMGLANLAALDLVIPQAAGDSGLLQYFVQQIDPGLTWKDLTWLRSITSLPIVVKGILRGDDASCAVDHGVAGVIVSNHGGRQLDGAIATIDALPEVVEAVSDRADVLMDGGIRRGTDILKALALGAKAVLVGRPILWGLAVDGAPGVQHVLELLRDELDTAMALSGCARLADIDASLIQAKVHYH